MSGIHVTGLEAEQGAEAMGLKVKHHAAFGRPDSVCQSLLSSFSCPLRCATACTPRSLNLTNAEQDNCSEAGGLIVSNVDANKDIQGVLTGFNANDQIRTLNSANMRIL